ncbi:MAG: hypothetical protein GY807_13765 [Gammaproteobacteria bacterium]|nr:hypothetical protein [Gammaproteobacteria bacterium]
MDVLKRRWIEEAQKINDVMLHRHPHDPESVKNVQPLTGKELEALASDLDDIDRRKSVEIGLRSVTNKAQMEGVLKSVNDAVQSLEEAVTITAGQPTSKKSVINILKRKVITRLDDQGEEIVVADVEEWMEVIPRVAEIVSAVFKDVTTDNLDLSDLPERDYKQDLMGDILWKLYEAYFPHGSSISTQYAEDSESGETFEDGPRATFIHCCLLALGYEEGATASTIRKAHQRIKPNL